MTKNSGENRPVNKMRIVVGGALIYLAVKLLCMKPEEKIEPAWLANLIPILFILIGLFFLWREMKAYRVNFRHSSSGRGEETENSAYIGESSDETGADDEAEREVLR